MDLNLFIKQIKSLESIKRKIRLFHIMENVQSLSFKSQFIYKGMGEDSASIYIPHLSENILILLTTDSINETFCSNFPWSAGFSSILVCLEDINACGGYPIAASINVSTNKQQIQKEILNGILSASQKFRIPIIRGHTSDETSNVGITSTIIGYISKEDYISAGNAKINDEILLIYDSNGRPAKSNKFYWDTVTYKSSDEILNKFEFMQNLAKKHLANAAKDISNGGLFGTLILMLKYSNVGANIILNNIEIPKILKDLNYSLLDFVSMYLTTSYLITSSQFNVNEIKKLARIYELECYSIGNIIQKKQVILTYDNQSEIAWEF